MSPLLYDIPGPPIRLGPGRADLRNSSVPFGAWAGGGMGVEMVDRQVVSYAMLFATQPWIAAAVMRLMTWSVRVPLKVYRRTGDDSRERLMPGDHPLADAVATPWPRGCTADLTMGIVGSASVHGNSVTTVNSGAGDKIQFTQQDWRRTMPIITGDLDLVGWTIDNGLPAEDTVGVDTALHVAWWSPLGPLGVSPLRQLGVTIRIEEAAQRYQTAMMRNSARPPSAIQASDAWLGFKPDERAVLLKQLREDVNVIYAGPENNGRPALLPPGLTWEKVGHTAVEAELIDQRKVAREEMAGVYLIPPPMLGILDKATYSNIQTQREMAYTDSLGPPLVLTEQRFNAQVVRGLLREPDIYVEYDFAVVLRGDRLKEIQALREAIAGGFLTPNEARDTENRPRIDNELADKTWMPWNNLRPIDWPQPLARGATPVAPDENPEPTPAPAADEPSIGDE